MFEPEFIDEERVPLINQYENNDDSIYEDSQAETSFNNDDDVQEETQKLDTEINALERGFNVKIPPEERGRFAATFKSRSLQVNTPISQNPTVSSWQKALCVPA